VPTAFSKHNSFCGLSQSNAFDPAGLFSNVEEFHTEKVAKGLATGNRDIDATYSADSKCPLADWESLPLEKQSRSQFSFMSRSLSSAIFRLRPPNFWLVLALYYGIDPENRALYKHMRSFRKHLLHPRWVTNNKPPLQTNRSGALETIIKQDKC
jgi:hypothetical protein